MSTKINRKAVARTVDASPLWNLVPNPLQPTNSTMPTPEIGARIVFELWTSPDHYGNGDLKAAQAIKDSLEASGNFEVNIRTAPWSEFRTSFARGEYQAWLMGLFPDFPDPDAYLSALVAAPAARALGVNYDSPTAEALVVAQRSSNSQADRQKSLGQLSELLAAEVPYVPLWQERWHVMSDTAVTGAEVGFSQIFDLARLGRKP